MHDLSLTGRQPQTELEDLYHGSLPRVTFERDRKCSMNTQNEGGPTEYEQETISVISDEGCSVVLEIGVTEACAWSIVHASLVGAVCAFPDVCMDD